MSSLVSNTVTPSERKSALFQKLRNFALTMLGLGLGYLVVIVSTACLYAAWLQGDGRTITSQFLAFCAISGVVFSALGGYVAALVPQRAPVVHAALFSLMLTVSYLLPSLLFGFREAAFVYVMNVAIAISGAMIGGWFRYWQINKIAISSRTQATSKPQF